MNWPGPLGTTVQDAFTYTMVPIPLFSLDVVVMIIKVRESGYKDMTHLTPVPFNRCPVSRYFLDGPTRDCALILFAATCGRRPLLTQGGWFTRLLCRAVLPAHKQQCSRADAAVNRP